MPFKHSFKFLSLICFICFFFFLHVDSNFQTEELAILLKLKQYWQDPPLMSHWNNASNTHYCSWPELTCIDGSVTELKLSYIFNYGDTIPPFICDLNNITSLQLSDTYLYGDFPKALYNCSKLTHLDLSSNLLNGPISPNIQHLMPNLQILNLDKNLLRGNLPDSIFALKNLRELHLSNNRLCGEIPEVTASFNLTVIDLSVNKFEGNIPQGFGKLQKLSFLSLMKNQLSGEIPNSIAHLPDLKMILLDVNHFSGNLPPAFGQYSPLKQFRVSSNRFSGTLPEFLSNCRSLTMSINSNRFTGGLPKNICSKGNLVTLDASYNNLSGELFESLSNCRGLVTLRLSSNMFSGRIPTDIYFWKQIEEFSAENNQLSGPIPEMILLDVNNFSGTLPPAFGQYFPLKEFRVSSNRFTGRLPKNLCDKGNLVTLDASNNSLSGELFESLSNCRGLVTLRVGFNMFSGRISADFNFWKQIKELRAENNQLSGPIPKMLVSLRNLRILNLSRNQLSGRIPYQLGVFTDLYKLDLSSNPGLGTDPYDPNLPFNPGHSSSRFSYLKIMLIVSASVVAPCLGVLSIYILLVKLRSKNKEKKKPTNVFTWKFISFHVMGFRESNILSGMTEGNVIGQGGSGKVYCVRVDGAEGFVAVKKICSNKKGDQNLEKQFLAEVDMLGKIRHLNIVKLFCCISNESSKLLVYEYMENRSLDWWLHGNNIGGSSVSLVWPMRLKIAIGAAQGLCYMHHESSPPIIHRDVKSGNILLDAEFNAKVADFGLAKFFVNTGEANTASAIVGSFGYLAPEYAQTKRLNEKIDVYSFGVVLLELTTGKKANAGDEYTGLAQWAWRHMQEGNHIPDALDEDIRNSPDHVEEMVEMFKLGIFCTAKLPSARPSMKEVLHILQSFHLQN